MTERSVHSDFGAGPLHSQHTNNKDSKTSMLHMIYFTQRRHLYRCKIKVVVCCKKKREIALLGSHHSTLVGSGL